MITRFFQALNRWHTRNVTIRELAALSDWQLTDLGITRGEIPLLVDRLVNRAPELPTIAMTTRIVAGPAEKLPAQKNRDERAVAA